MKTITIFVCEICGNKLEDKKEIERCEKQGNEHKFNTGQEVEFLWAPEGIKRWMKAKVERTKFENGTHSPVYELRVIKAVYFCEESSVSL